MSFTKKVYCKPYTAPLMQWTGLSTVFVLTFFVLCNPIFAQQKKLTIASFNDNWGGGFGEIKDDYRSFGLHIADEFDWRKMTTKISLNYSGFTDKFSPDSTRLDELQLRANIPIFEVKKVLTFQAVAGAFLTGNLGGEAIQNTVHGQVGSSDIKLNYPDSLQFAPILGARLQAKFPIVATNNVAPMFRADAEYFWAYNYLSSARAKVGVGFENDWADALYFQIGLNYQYIENQPTRTAAAATERGIFLGIHTQLGLFNFGIISFLESNFSMGTIGITLPNTNGRKPLKEIDLTAEFGAFTKNHGLYQRFLWNKLTRYQQHFLFDIHHQFWRISGSSNPNYPNQFGDFRQISFGGYYQPWTPKSVWQILPYVSLRLGIKTEKLYSGEAAYFNQRVTSLNAIGEVGMKLKLPANFIHKNCYYGGTAGYSYAAPFYRSKDVVLENGYQFAQAVGALSVGAFVMIDL